MPGEVPTLRRSHSSSSSAASATDIYDQAEQGLSTVSNGAPATARPLESRKAFSLRYSLRSSDSTLAEVASQDQIDDPVKPLPQQESSKASSLIRVTANFFAVLRSLLTLSFLGLNNITQKPSQNYQLGYDQFKYQHYEDFPVGWPRVASFLDGCDSFSHYRRHGRIHSRLLITHMSNIADLEEQLDKLDREDQNGGAATSWRLKTRYHEEGLDTTKIEVMKKLETEVLAYDKLLLYHQRLMSLHKTSAKDHGSVFRWLWKTQPLDIGEFNWIFYPNDFVSMLPPSNNQFENFISNHLHARPNSFLKRFCVAQTSPHDSSTSVDYLSTARIKTFARIIVVLIAVSVLFTPVILFLLTSMSRAWMAIIVLFFFFLFSGILSLLTEAGVLEIFVGTATYCAVLVTFLGNLQNAPK